MKAGGVVECFGHGHDCHGGAVRVRDDAFGWRLGFVGVDLGDDEGDVVVLAPRGGVVHDGGAGGCEDWGPLLGGAAACGEERDVDVGDGVFGDLGEVFDDDVLAAVFEVLTCGAW